LAGSIPATGVAAQSAEGSVQKREQRKHATKQKADNFLEKCAMRTPYFLMVILERQWRGRKSEAAEKEYRSKKIDPLQLNYFSV
jgi:hypothetical protein